MAEAPSDDGKLARVARALRQFAVFDDLDDAALASVARLAQPVPLPRGARLDEPAAAVGSIYLIVEGRLRLYREAPAGRQVTLRASRRRRAGGRRSTASLAHVCWRSWRPTPLCRRASARSSRAPSPAPMTR